MWRRGNIESDLALSEEDYKNLYQFVDFDKDQLPQLSKDPSSVKLQLDILFRKGCLKLVTEFESGKKEGIKLEYTRLEISFQDTKNNWEVQASIQQMHIINFDHFSQIESFETGIL